MEKTNSSTYCNFLNKNDIDLNNKSNSIQNSFIYNENLSNNNLDEKLYKYSKDPISKLDNDNSIEKQLKNSKNLKPLSKRIGQISNVQFFDYNSEPFEIHKKIKFYEKKVKLKKRFLYKNNLEKMYLMNVKFNNLKIRNLTKVHSQMNDYISENKINFSTSKASLNSEFVFFKKDNFKSKEESFIINNSVDIKPNMNLNNVRIINDNYKNNNDLANAVKNYFKSRNSKGIKNYLGNSNSFIRLKPSEPNS